MYKILTLYTLIFTYLLYVQIRDTVLLIYHRMQLYGSDKKKENVG